MQRKWVACGSSVRGPRASNEETLTAVSYNILAPSLAREHHRELYSHIPPHIMAWPNRKRAIMKELQTLNPDIICMQEVESFEELQSDLRPLGFHGCHQMRTGDASDGCAIFWNSSRFDLVQMQPITYRQLDLRDNVALLTVLQRRDGREGASAAPHEYGEWAEERTPAGSQQRLVVGCIHVLFNPKRGDIKLGQVRTLMEQANELSAQHMRAPVLIGGDFNSTPASSIYEYLASAEVNLSGVDRRTMSGQLTRGLGKQPSSWQSPSPPGQPSQRYSGADLSSAPRWSAEPGRQPRASGGETCGTTQEDAGARGGNAGAAVDEVELPRDKSAHKRWKSDGEYEDFMINVSGPGGAPTIEHQEKSVAARPIPAVWQSAWPDQLPTGGNARWEAEELLAATGLRDCHIATNPRPMRSAYAQAEGSEEGTHGEPRVTSYHRKFSSTVDYIWHSEELRALQVLAVVSMRALRATGGLPSRDCPSDHLPLVCQLEWPAPDGDLDTRNEILSATAAVENLESTL